MLVSAEYGRLSGLQPNLSAKNISGAVSGSAALFNASFAKMGKLTH
jgi:hypothetical protein